MAARSRTPKPKNGKGWSLAEKLIVAVIVAIVGVLIKWWLEQPVPPPSGKVTFVQPSNGSSVTFIPATVSGQGGRVEVELEATGLAPQETVLLTVEPDGFAEVPQWGESAKYENVSPEWSGSVQIGDADNAPKTKQWFTLRAYVVTADQYDLHSQLDNPDHERPPRKWENPTSSAAACRFQLR
jgi:hypothetical protein